MTQPPSVRERLRIRLERAGASLDEGASNAFAHYFSLLARWNPRMNLTSLPLDPPGDETIDRLFVEPVVAAEHLGARASRDVPLQWIDLGSGGGSPAIPLKIVRPSWPLTMVEAKGRKAAFLREAIRVLHLQDATVENIRLEQLETTAAADVVTVRAVKLDSALANAARQMLKSDGVLAVFGSSEASLSGFVVERSVSLIAASVAVLTLLRVPRGT